MQELSQTTMTLDEKHFSDALHNVMVHALVSSRPRGTIVLSATLDTVKQKKTSTTSSSYCGSDTVVRIRFQYSGLPLSEVNQLQYFVTLYILDFTDILLL